MLTGATVARRPLRKPVPLGARPLGFDASHRARPAARAVGVKKGSWRRWTLGAVVAIAVLVGMLGWTHYLQGPAPVSAPIGASVRAASAAPLRVGAATAAPRGPEATSTRRVATDDAGVVPLPENASAKELQEALRSGRDDAQLFERQQRDRVVTWAGVVTKASRLDRLVQVDLADGDGVHIEAWCLSASDVAIDARVTVRGRLARRLPDGFVVDRCELL